MNVGGCGGVLLTRKEKRSHYRRGRKEKGKGDPDRLSSLLLSLATRGERKKVAPFVLPGLFKRKKKKKKRGGGKSSGRLL